MAGQITLTEQEARALSSLLDRASDRLATYEEQTHQNRRLAEEIREAAATWSSGSAERGRRPSVPKHVTERLAVERTWASSAAQLVGRH